MPPSFMQRAGQVSKADHNAPVRHNAFRRLSEIAVALQLSRSDLEHIKHLLGQAVGEKWRGGRSLELKAASCVYLCCRRNRRPLTMLDVAEAVGLNVFSLGRAYQEVKRTLQYPTDDVDPALFIESTLRAAGLVTPALPPALVRSLSDMSIRLVNILKEDWSVTGRLPSGIVGAAVAVACEAFDIAIPYASLMDQLRIRKDTIVDVRRKLKRKLLGYGKKLPWGDSITMASLSVHIDFILQHYAVLHDRRVEAMPGAVTDASAEAARLIADEEGFIQPTVPFGEGRKTIGAMAGALAAARLKPGAMEAAAKALDAPTPSESTAMAGTTTADDRDPPSYVRARKKRLKRRAKIARVLRLIGAESPPPLPDSDLSLASVTATAEASAEHERRKRRKLSVRRAESAGFLAAAVSAAPLSLDEARASVARQAEGGRARVRLVGSGSAHRPATVARQTLKKAWQKANTPAGKLDTEDLLIARLLLQGVSPADLEDGMYRSLEVSLSAASERHAARVAALPDESLIGEWDVDDSEMAQLLRPKASVQAMRILAEKSGIFEVPALKKASRQADALGAGESALAPWRKAYADTQDMVKQVHAKNEEVLRLKRQGRQEASVIASQEAKALVVAAREKLEEFNRLKAEHEAAQAGQKKRKRARKDDGATGDAAARPNKKRAGGASAAAAAEGGAPEPAPAAMPQRRRSTRSTPTGAVAAAAAAAEAAEAAGDAVAAVAPAVVASRRRSARTTPTGADTASASAGAGVSAEGRVTRADKRAPLRPVLKQKKKKKRGAARASAGVVKTPSATAARATKKKTSVKKKETTRAARKKTSVKEEKAGKTSVKKKATTRASKKKTSVKKRATDKQ